MRPDPGVLGRWEPASPKEVGRLFGGVAAPWWIAGGWAIELAVGRRVREHADIDVLVLRRDQLVVQDALRGWEWWAADPPGTLRPWLAGEVLPAEVHDIWCRPGPARPWAVQVMLDEADGPDWVSRRDSRIRRPVETLGSVTGQLPYLNAEVQLFYKARARRPKDEVDFDVAEPLLDEGQRRWLRDAIALAYGPHDWLGRLGVIQPRRR